MTARLVPWSPEGHQQVRVDLAMLSLTVKTAVITALAGVYARSAPGTDIGDAQDDILTALEPLLAEIRQKCSVAVMHLDQATERARRKQNAAEQAIIRAERLIGKALAGLQPEVIPARGMPHTRNRWRPDESLRRQRPPEPVPAT